MTALKHESVAPVPPAPDIELTSQESPLQLDSRDKAEIEARKAIEEFMKLPLKERQAKMAIVYDRGVINDRLKVEMPDDLYGEWVRDDPLDIKRLESMGFWVDTNYAAKRAIHSDGSSGAKVGDVIHMITMRSNKELLDAVVREKQIRVNDPRQKQTEDNEFIANVAQSTDGEIKAFTEGKERPVNMNDVREAIKAANLQTSVQR